MILPKNRTIEIKRMEGVSNLGYVPNVEPSPSNNQKQFIKIELDENGPLERVSIEGNEYGTDLNEPENLNDQEPENQSENRAGFIDKDSPDPNESSILARTILSFRLYVDNLVKNV